MTEKIIALLDGSIYSASVCDHLAWAAPRMGVGVELLHVVGRREAPPKPEPDARVLGARSALQQELAALDEQRAKLASHRGLAILEDAQKMLQKGGVADVTTELRHGDLIGTVTAKEAAAAMVMIGKRGEAADYAIGHLGSNMERIVRATKKPVFVASRAFRPIRKVLVAYDGGAPSMKAIDFISRSPLFTGLSIDVVTVGHKSPEIDKALGNASAMLRAAGIKAETGTVPGQPETALGRLVEEAEFDMLVMGAYGHSRIRSLFIGSTTTEMIRSCKVPIILIR